MSFSKFLYSQMTQCLRHTSRGFFPIHPSKHIETNSCEPERWGWMGCYPEQHPARSSGHNLNNIGRPTSRYVEAIMICCVFHHRIVIVPRTPHLPANCWRLHRGPGCKVPGKVCQRDPKGGIWQAPIGVSRSIQIYPDLSRSIQIY